MDKKLKSVFAYCGDNNLAGGIRAFMVACVAFCITVYILTLFKMNGGQNLFMMAPGVMILVNLGVLDLGYNANNAVTSVNSRGKNVFSLISLLSVLPMTRLTYDKWQFRHSVTDNILYLYLLLPINIIFMVRGSISSISGTLGFISLVAIITMILEYVMRFMVKGQNAVACTGVIRIVLCCLLLIGMLVSQTSVFEHFETVLNKIFGIFAGPFSIVVPVLIFVYTIIHFNVKYAGKKGSWRCG